MIVGRLLENSKYNWGFKCSDQRVSGLGCCRRHRPRQGSAYSAQAASSVAGLLITTEAMVAELPKKDTSLPAAPGGMDY